ncbi:MAG TPA: hypothetical protein VLI41_02770 [Phenylobacterium sp.]|uniref:hypothetical protein n=1 Tax=Phenylobacterium sp. TaxID=1871053 RepID=UPI002B5249E4|nr:hypothetical protein [Phenylobacterium sp.]HSV02104.1 hypothetical protein [Phenylobacterium sp.]
MAAFSSSDAAIEGFRVIGARWRVLVGWSLFNLIALVALLVVLVVAVAAVSALAASDETAQTAGGAIGGVIVGLGELLVQVMLVSGLFRMELRPEAPGFLHLRIGRDEMRVLGALLLVIVAAIPLALVLAAAVAAGARVSPALALLVALVGATIFYGVLLRFGLVSPIAFAEARLSLVESWRRTRGQFWALVGMALLLLCFWAIVAVIAWFALFLVGGLATGFRDLGLSGTEALEAHPGRYLFQLAAQVLLAPFWLVIGVAPWIAVYRALAPAPRD